ncbi:hypothetical protein TTHERM_000334609 (macronuclear) [Tetrahymena thermophila SB210]|uniref:Uncharacterized protein n=1 Tax=Tetrahymena thermophila (strain SB210) TaxID=312017 RepID=W7XHS9_TETTS|nr:hypothetical protein TTHERM_000334609 [Tetrahymena thermophila SB210]EWS74021.1 hypothetical protein TTHERM_000334609 [Tetrahymena thermophila SB210]|eukprot:XP_012653420.1 hypothetical protein TTHERM_000334609 [Tetrahymena thermophila SB210]
MEIKQLITNFYQLFQQIQFNYHYLQLIIYKPKILQIQFYILLQLIFICKNHQAQQQNIYKGTLFLKLTKEQTFNIYKIINNFEKLCYAAIQKYSKDNQQELFYDS